MNSEKIWKIWSKGKLKSEIKKKKRQEAQTDT